MNKEKLILPASILLGCLIMGLSFYAIQANKQAGVDRELQAQVLLSEKLEAEKASNALSLSFCLSDAETAYWDYMELNGTKNKETGVINAYTMYWDRAKEDKQTAINNCYKQYK